MTTSIFEKLSKLGYVITNKRVLGKPEHTSIETREKDLIQEIALISNWLCKEHGIWIVVNPHKGEDDLGKPFMEFDPEVWSFTNECVFHNTGLLYYNSPTEAYEAAIEYTLNNLI